MKLVQSPLCRWILLSAALLRASSGRCEIARPPDVAERTPAKAGSGPEERSVLEFGFAGAEGVAFDEETRAWVFDGKTGLIPLDASLPKKIGLRDFSLLLEARIDHQPGHTAYILEHHRDFPWTGLFLAVHDDHTLRFRLKDLPHCEVSCDIRELVGDGKFHRVQLNRAGTRLALLIDGKVCAAGDKPELVDLDIDYAGHSPTLGAHCDGKDAFFKGALRGLRLHIGSCLDDIWDVPSSPSPDGFLAARVAGLVLRLREGDAPDRATAVREIKELDPIDSLPLLRPYRDDPDPEVGETIRALLDR